MSSIDIRPMEQWYELEHSIRIAFDHFPRAALKNYNAEKLRAELLHPDAQYYVALVHGGVKGFAGWKRTGINTAVFELPWCIVHPEYRKQGIGRALTERRIADIKERGGRAILLTTPSPEIYEKYGFKTIRVLEGLWAKYLMMAVPEV